MKVYSTGNLGDAIACIPAIRSYVEKTGQKVTYGLVANVPAFYYEGATHPTKDKDGSAVMLNEKMIEMISPLLLAQDCIESVETIQFDDIKDDIAAFDKTGIHFEWVRKTEVGMPAQSINQWPFFVFPDLWYDLTKQWLFVPDSEKDLAKDKIIITRSERYHNETINYEFLKEFEDDCVFIGTQREWNQFCMQYDLQIRKLHVNNFLEMAQAIKQSKFHLSNQTMANQIGTGLMHPGILETCVFASNCIQTGKDRYAFLHQGGLEYFVNKLMDREEWYIEKLKSAKKVVPM